MSTMLGEYVVTKRGNVHYWRSEEFDLSRTTLVFLHGLTADHTLFDRQVEYFYQSYNLLVWDAPAHGASRPYSAFSYPNAAEDLKQILEKLGIVSAVLIGQSMGGFMSQSFILRYPQFVKAFVGVDTCPFGDHYYSGFDRWMLRQVGWMASLYPFEFLKKSVAKQCTLTEYARENMYEALRYYTKAELCNLMGMGLGRFLDDNQVMTISCPGLLLCGEFDRTGNTIRYNKAWTEDTGFPLVFIKNAAHNSNADAPEAVNASIEKFVRELV